MGSNILSIGQSALSAAQAGLETTGHNIANANTPGYSRQLVLQTSAGGQDLGVGFVGKGTEVATILRVFNEFLNTQVLGAQTSSSQLETHFAQISRVNNLLADASAGLSPALQDFFKGVQDLAANPSSAAARQSALSSAEMLEARFKSIDGQLTEMHQSVNAQITAGIGTINSLAVQISKLNDSIEIAQGGTGAKPANDLLDQRDQLIADLSKEVKVTVAKQGNSYSVFIGNGQPLVVGKQTFALTPMASPTDLGRIEVGYVAKGATKLLPENSLPGGKLGGLFEFRAKTLDVARNSLGLVATGLAAAFNAQHQLGQDQNGALGGAFFTAAAPLVSASTANTSTATVSASISDASALTRSDYRLQITSGSVPGPAAYQITRLSDGTVTPVAGGLPTTVDGVDFDISAVGTQVTGDDFLIRPTVNGAAGFSVAVTDITKIAAAAPLRTTAFSGNTGSGKITAGTVNSPPPPDLNLQQPVTITFTSATTFDVTGTGTGNPVGVAYTADGDITYNGWTVKISGTPAVGDKFTIGPNTGGVGDNRNALLLAALQTANTLDKNPVSGKNTSTFQSAYGQLVNQIGNKAHELEVTSSAENKRLAQAVASQQSESGVNLDEEATNLLRYQQAYQAAAKVMQTASALFDVLLSLGR